MKIKDYLKKFKLKLLATWFRVQVWVKLLQKYSFFLNLFLTSLFTFLSFVIFNDLYVSLVVIYICAMVLFFRYREIFFLTIVMVIIQFFLLVNNFTDLYIQLGEFVFLSLGSGFIKMLFWKKD